MKSRNFNLSTHRPTINYEIIINNLDKGAKFLDFRGIYLTKEQLNDLAKRITNNAFIGHIIWGALPNGTEDLIEQIENKLVENNKSYKSHPTDLVHGLLSSHSYQTSKVGDKVEFTADSEGIPHVNAKYNEYLEDWHVAQLFQPEKANDYHSVLYVNDKTHHAVLAHRGIDIIKSLKGHNSSVRDALIEMFHHNIGVQQAASYVVTKEALEVAQELGYNFSTTGHSLGAWLAELSLYFCHMDFDYPQVKAVTFDSPGSKDQMDVLKSNIHNGDTKARINQFDMVTYLSAPNIVNVCNQHVGKVYRLAPEIKYPEILKKELPTQLPKFVKNIIAQNKHYLDSLLSVSGHSLSSMLEVFDPDTGTPYPDKYTVVLDWPHIKHEANTQPVQKLLKEVFLDNIPIISSTPYSLKDLAVKAIDKLVPNSTIGSVVTVIASFLSGDIAISQLCETFRHFDLNTYGKGYLLKDLSSLNQFALSYQGHYKTQTVNLSKARLITKYKGSIDWYLSQVAKISPLILEKNLDEFSCLQLNIIKNGFKTQHINGKNYVSLIEQNQHNIATIEQFKGYLSRLIEVNPSIKRLLDNGFIKYFELLSENNSNIIASDLPDRIHNFVERCDVFNQIENILSNKQVVAINAFAGTGKSSAALEYGHVAKENGKIVRWFAADTINKIEANYRQLALDLGINVTQKNLTDINNTKDQKVTSAINTEQEQKILIHSVNNALSKLGKPILLIFDNLENYQDIKEYLANLPQKLVKVIITTRDNNLLNNPDQQITLEPFNNKDAISYINTNLPGRVNNKTSEDLINLLGNKEGEVLPYRLSKTIGFLQANKLWSAPKYIEYIKQHASEQAETTLLIESLKGFPLELQILQYAAFLDPDSMSIEIFKELLNIDEKQLQGHIAKLEKLSLVKLNHNEDNTYLKMHRLAQEEIIRYINSNQNQENQQILTLGKIQHNLIVSLNNLMPLVTAIRTDDWQVASFYYPHIQKILVSSTGLTSNEKGKLYEKLADYNRYITRDYQQFLDHNLNALKIYTILYGEDNHSNIANSLHSIGVAYYYLDQTDLDLEYSLKALKMRQELHKDANDGDHHDVAISLLNVGAAYANLGRIEESLKYRVLSLEMSQRLHQTSAKGTDIAATLGHISTLYGESGNIEKQLECQEQVFKINQEIFKDPHPDIAHCLNNLGINYKYLGQIERGLQYQEQALRMLQTLYKESNDKGKTNFSVRTDIANILYSIGTTYYSLGDKLKALELYKQSYSIKFKMLGEHHSETEELKNKIFLENPQSFDPQELRISIFERGIVDRNIITVKKHIQQKTLDIVYKLASKGLWNPTARSKCIKKYLSDNHLKQTLGEFNSIENVQISKMLCFEAMCLGVMSSAKKNFTCIKKFAKAYPELLGQIIAEHPEYMVDGSIVKICVTDPTILTKLLGENFSGQGNADYIETDPLMEYTKEGMDKLLTLRLEAAEQRDVKTIIPNYVWDGTEDNAQIITNEISSNLGERSLVVLNLFGKHWVGLVIKKEADNINITYLDSEQEVIPEALKKQLVQQISLSYPGHNIELSQAELETQRYNNCGPEVIENLTALLFGGVRTTSQEDAVAIHSVLFEDLLTYPVLHRSSLMPSFRAEEEVLSTLPPLQLLSGNGTGILLLENAHD